MRISPICEAAPTEVLDETQQAVYDALARLQIPFQRVSHDHADTMEDCLAVGQVLGVPVCKNLVLCNRQKTRYYLLLMPGDKPFFTRDLSQQIGSSRLSFADPGAMEELLHVVPGSASVLALLFDTEHRVKLVVDEELRKVPLFACHPCNSGSTLRLRTEDVFQRLLPYTGHTPQFVELPRYPVTEW